MIELPGISSEAWTYLLVFGVGFLAWVFVLARLILELFINTKQRFAGENLGVAVLGTPAIPALMVAGYFYTLSMLTLASAWFPEEIPNLAAQWALALLGVSDQLFGITQETPYALSWLAAAGTVHVGLELLLYLVGMPRRRRERRVYMEAVDAIGQPKPAEKSILKKSRY